MTEEGSGAFLIRTTNGREGVLAKKGRQRPCRLGKYGVNRANLKQIGVGVVEMTLREKEVIVIDEIGKIRGF
jgi:nucleoside-triphosphatase